MIASLIDLRSYWNNLLHSVGTSLAETLFKLLEQSTVLSTYDEY